MAKEQNLSLNPTKISGLCGRLMCCLKNEEEAYEELNKRLPRRGDEVTTPDGKLGEVQSVDILREKVRVFSDNGDSREVREYHASELKYDPLVHKKAKHNKQNSAAAEILTPDPIQMEEKVDEKELEKLEQLEELEESLIKAEEEFKEEGNKKHSRDFKGKKQGNFKKKNFNGNGQKDGDKKKFNKKGPKKNFSKNNNKKFKPNNKNKTREKF